MIEYLYDAVRATHGEDVVVSAIITDDEGGLIMDNCYLALFDDDGEITKVYGAFDGEQWSFTVPADFTEGLKGRYWYTIGRNFQDMCFRKPLYMV